MRFFDKKEMLIVGSVLVIISVLSFYNLKISLRRARDFQRKDDIGIISNGIFLFKEDFGFYPPSSPDGKILACKKEGIDTPCDWGWDSLSDISDASYAPYIKTIPADPSHGEGRSYLYISTLDNFQILASLEGKDEAEYVKAVEDRGLKCGKFICNIGKGSPGVPLDKSLEEYENEVNAKKR